MSSFAANYIQSIISASHSDGLSEGNRVDGPSKLQSLESKRLYSMLVNLNDPLDHDAMRRTLDDLSEDSLLVTMDSRAQEDDQVFLKKMLEERILVGTYARSLDLCLQEAIEADRAKADEIRKQLDDPEAKAAAERYDAIKAELDELKKEGDEAYASRSKLLDERTALQGQLDELYNRKRESAARYKEANDKFYTKLTLIINNARATANPHILPKVDKWVSFSLANHLSLT